MTNGMLKWPLLIAAGLVVARVISEQLGAPESINVVFGVVWLYFIVPFYFVSAIVKNGSTRPYLELLWNLFVFSLTTRLMVLPTYWLAYAFQWPAVTRSRISVCRTDCEPLPPTARRALITVATEATEQAASLNCLT